MKPQDGFRNEATIKIVFPRELVVRTDMTLLNRPSFMSDTPTVLVEFNRQIKITNAFPNGYDPDINGPITFSMFGIHNPISTA